MKYLFFFLFTASFLNVNSQQMDASVTVNSEQINVSNKAIFKTLENTIRDYINENDFIDKTVRNYEKIKCNFFIIITNFSEDGSFLGTMQIQSYRPVYGTNYNSPVFTYIEKKLDFRYMENEPFIYNPYTFTSNLLSILDYYIYLIIGLDADTFSIEENRLAYEKANRVVDLAVSSGYSGWNISERESRSLFMNNINDNSFKKFREGLYLYHFKGLDNLYKEDKITPKKEMIKGINYIFDIYQSRTNSFLINSFLLSKQEELNYIFREKYKVENQDAFLERASNMIPNFSGVRKNIYNKNN